MPELGFYKVQEVSEVLKINLIGVYDLIKKGELKACRFSERRIRIDASDLMEFIQKSKGLAQDGPRLEIPCDCR